MNLSKQEKQLIIDDLKNTVYLEDLWQEGYLKGGLGIVNYEENKSKRLALIEKLEKSKL